MPKIGSQHKWKDKDFTPACAWEDDTFVQWGGKGVVLGGKNSYTTAFFEAFPDDRENVSGFIRGEGKTIGEAESDAFKKYLKNKACDKHEYTRNRSKTNQYHNGLGFCKKCGSSKSGAFNDVIKLGDYKKPLSKFALEHYCQGTSDTYKQHNGKTVIDQFGDEYYTFDDELWNREPHYIGDTYYGAIRKGVPDKDSHLRKTYLKWRLHQKGVFQVTSKY